MRQSCENFHFVGSNENGVSSVVCKKDVFLKKKKVFSAHIPRSFKNLVKTCNKSYKTTTEREWKS